MLNLFDISCCTTIDLNEISSIVVNYNCHDINMSGYPYFNKANRPEPLYEVWGECYIKLKNGDSFTLDKIEDIHNFLGVNKPSLWQSLLGILRSKVKDNYYIKKEVSSFIVSLES